MMHDRTIGIGFCVVCQIRLFKDDEKDKDYFVLGKDMVCRECIDEVHKCEDCRGFTREEAEMHKKAILSISNKTGKRIK